MTEVRGTTTAIVDLAVDLRSPLGAVQHALERARIRASAYEQARSTLPLSSVRVPPQAEEVLAWIADVAAVMDRFSGDLDHTDARFVDGPAAGVRLSGSFDPDLVADGVGRATTVTDLVEAGLHLSLTRWGDVRRHSMATLRIWRLRRRLTTAGDFRGTGLPRPPRRTMMRDTNRPIHKQIGRQLTERNAARTSVAQGRGGAWTRIRNATGRVATRFPRTASVARAGGRVLAVAGVAMSVNDVVFGVRDGNDEQVGLGLAGLGAAAAFAAGGPAGIAIGVAFVGGSLVWENRDAIADYGRRKLDQLSDVGDDLADGVADARDRVNEVVDDVGDALGDAATGVVSTVGGWFD